MAQEGEHAGIAFVEVEGDQRAVAVHAQRQLGQVVGADGEAVEQFGELVHQQDVVRDLAHDVDLQPVAPALQAVALHRAEHPLRLVQAAAEGHHDLDVGQPHVATHAGQRPALQREAFLVSRMGVARRAPETQHGVFLDRLEPAPADQGGVFVGLEVRQADDHGTRVKGGGDGADFLRQPLDE